jgi:DNA-binding IclR family transcriptional regulator
MTTAPRYQAPALTKGLQILELLAESETAPSMSDISTALGRSVSEIFRMLQVLEGHRYIARDDTGYRLTNRLFTLGMRQPPIRNLVARALPVMQGLARRSGQSCHLAVASGGDMVVIAGVEAPGLIGFAVRVGYRRPLHLSASGQILLAFQSPETRATMLAAIHDAGYATDRAALAATLGSIAAERLTSSPSPMLTGITDLSIPILFGGAASAAMTIPFVNGAGSMDRTIVAAMLLDAARDLEGLGFVSPE